MKKGTGPGARLPLGKNAGYSGTPLPRKLGIKEGSKVLAFGAPADFMKVLGPLPDGAVVRNGGRGSADLLMVFVRSLAELKKGIKTLSSRDDKVAAWIAWPKKTSAIAGDVSERDVRELGIAAGMVDYKICAIDETWSGLLFSRKRLGG